MSRSARFVHFLDQDTVPRDAIARAASAAALTGPLDRSTSTTLAGWVRNDPDPRVRAAALGALVRAGGVGSARAAWDLGRADSTVAVRRRAAELAPLVGSVPLRPLIALSEDQDWSVAEMAAWAMGEISWSPTNRTRATRRLAVVTTDHHDPLVREAAVAAIGALGDRIGLAAVLTATGDRPAIRRRAVLALAPFDGAEVDEALARCLGDSDWQVRQAAEDLLGVAEPRAPEPGGRANRPSDERSP